MVAIALPIDTRSFMSVVSRDLPALADGAERAAVGEADVGEEHLVELGVARHLAQRAHLDAGRLHVDDEGGEAPVLGQRRDRCGRRAGPKRARVAQRGPHLLPVDDPLVAVADGPGREPGEVGAGARLGEQLAPDLLAGEERPQVALLAARRCRGDDRRRDHAEADEVEREVRRRAGGIEALDHDPLLRRIGRETSGALRGSGPTPVRRRSARRRTPWMPLSPAGGRGGAARRVPRCRGRALRSSWRQSAAEQRYDIRAPRDPLGARELTPGNAVRRGTVVSLST